MGNGKLDAQTNEINETYRLINYPASQLPAEFKNLIIAPFLNSLRYGNDLFKLIDKKAYFFFYGKYIEDMLQRTSSIIKLAMLDDDTVLGWCLFDNKIVHYVWVKKEVRRQGIARSLVPKDFDTITHITNKGMNIWANKLPDVRFNPFL